MGSLKKLRNSLWANSEKLHQLGFARLGRNEACVWRRVFMPAARDRAIAADLVLRELRDRDCHQRQ